MDGARDTNIVRWYKEDQVVDVVRSDPIGINVVSEIDIAGKGELGVLDGSQRIVAM